ncbi:hypothetical protein RB595_005625 [Gaeumannomyces hyphopodioides]
MRPLRTPSRLLQQSAGSSSFVCRSCLSRGFVSAAATPSTSGIAALKSRQLISVSGRDAAKYLQGVITANIFGPGGTPRTSGFYTAFLSAQGRVLFDAFIYPGLGPTPPADGADSFLVEVDVDHADSLVAHINRYKLRAKLVARLLDPQESTVWQAWDDSYEHGSGLPAFTVDGLGASKAGNPRLLLRDPRSPTLGSRVITTGPGNATAASRLSSFLKLEPTAELHYRVRRYLNGVAEGQSELRREQALPAESNMDLFGAIDFRKGCYVGQELTVRTKHRGVVRKRVLPCMIFDGETPPASLRYEPSTLPLLEDGAPKRDLADDDDSMSPTPPADVVTNGESITRLGRTGRGAGKWLAGTGNIGLALCRLDVMTDLPPPPGETPTYDPNDIFVMSASSSQDKSALAPSRTVRVKAFVPDWLRRGLANQAQAAARGH